MHEEPGPDDTVFADTNLFVAVDGPDNWKYQTLREYAIRRDLLLLVPQRVERELSTMHVANRVDTAVDEGWAEIVDPPSPRQADAEDAMDFVRRELARRTDRDEHEVEKADTIFAGLAIEYLKQEGDNVVVLTDDRVAADAITRAVANQGYGEAVTVLTRADVIDDDDDLRII